MVAVRSLAITIFDLVILAGSLGNTVCMASVVVIIMDIVAILRAYHYANIDLVATVMPLLWGTIDCLTQEAVRRLRCR